MNPERQFVFDNNVLVSTFLFRNGTPRQAFDLAVSIGQILRSDQTLDEIWEVLMRPKFDRYLSLAERMTLLKGFEQISFPVIPSIEVTLCRDPKDDKFLSLALSANAECITSGDQDLLLLADSFPIQILTPAQFLEQKQIPKEQK